MPDDKTPAPRATTQPVEFEAWLAHAGVLATLLGQGQVLALAGPTDARRAYDAGVHAIHYVQGLDKGRGA